MVSKTTRDKETSDENPLNEFSGCHEGIFDNFRKLLVMLEMLGNPSRADEVRVMAKAQLGFFKEVVLEHHSEEEQELFTAVMDSASAGQEADQAKEYIDRLVSEHRDLEAMWASIENDIRRLSKGKPAELDREIAEKLAHDYLDHATFEEQYFLPLSAKILSKNDLSALGMSLHMRHLDENVPNYI
jgi:hemerythrin-like domain-containing protein